MIRDYLKLATNSLRKRRLRTILTMIGIFIGIAAVVSLISLGQGLEDAIAEEFFQLGADKVQIVVRGPTTGPPGSGSDIQLTTSDLAVVERVPGVQAAGGRLIEPIRVEFNSRERFLYVASIPQERDARALVAELARIQDEHFVDGRMLRPEDSWQAVMSTTYRDNPRFNNQALRVGDRILVEGQEVQVVGFYETTGNPIFDSTIVMNEQAVRDMLGEPDKFGVIGAQISPGADMGIVVDDITNDLRRHRGLDEGDEDFNVNTAEDVLETFTAILGVVTAVLIGIASISLIVGGIGIMNTMYTSVLERRREIGIMKAIGARNKDVMSIFLIESAILGFVGGLIGVLIGAGFSLLVQLIATLTLGTPLIQASFSATLIFGALAFSVVVGTFAGVFPAKQASELPPVEALRQ